MDSILDVFLAGGAVTLGLGAILFGWPLFFYRRFSCDGRVRPLGRTILWSIGFYFLCTGVGEVAISATRTENPGFVAAFVSWLSILLVAAPLLVNAFALVMHLVKVKK